MCLLSYASRYSSGIFTENLIFLLICFSQIYFPNIIINYFFILGFQFQIFSRVFNTTKTFLVAIVHRVHCFSSSFDSFVGVIIVVGVAATAVHWPTASKVARLHGLWVSVIYSISDNASLLSEMSHKNCSLITPSTVSIWKNLLLEMNCSTKFMKSFSVYIFNLLSVQWPQNIIIGNNMLNAPSIVANLFAYKFICGKIWSKLHDCYKTH